MAMASAVGGIESADQPLGGIERDGKIAYELASLFGDLSPLIVRVDVEQVEGDPHAGRIARGAASIPVRNGGRSGWPARAELASA
jgi:hypothetical protein